MCVCVCVCVCGFVLYITQKLISKQAIIKLQNDTFTDQMFLQLYLFIYVRKK